MPKTKRRRGLDLCQGPPLILNFWGKFRGVEMFFVLGGYGDFKFKSGVLIGFSCECVMCARGTRKSVGQVENLLKRLNFEKLLCLKQRKRAALVA